MYLEARGTQCPPLLSSFSRAHLKGHLRFLKRGLEVLFGLKTGRLRVVMMIPTQTTRED